MLAARWSFYDLWRTAWDRTVQQGGVLAVQDDLVAAAELVLPFDQLDNVVDLTDYRQRKREAAEKRGRAHGTRDLSGVTALWLHQTAAMLGSPERFLSVPSHAGVDTVARVTLLHPLRAYLYHGHAANRFSIGIEVACRAAGIEGDGRTFWISTKEMLSGRVYSQLVHEATDEQIVATRHLVRYYIEEVERQAQPLRAQGLVVPGIRAFGDHRNSHKSRVSDPGSRLHHEVVEWAVREFDLKRGPVVGSGTLSPTVWTGEGNVPYSKKVSGIWVP